MYSEFLFKNGCHAKLKKNNDLQFIDYLKGNGWMNSFPKNISAVGNANRIVEDLNSGHRAHFL